VRSRRAKPGSTHDSRRDRHAVKPSPPGGTPIWVWIVYSLGILAAAIFVFSILFTAGAYILSNDVDVTFDVSTPAIVLWGGLMALAGGLWFWRRRKR
jgi:LPXTG-motif cell wall-anchored protein